MTRPPRPSSAPWAVRLGRMACAFGVACAALGHAPPAHAVGPRGKARVLLVMGGKGRSEEVAHTVRTFVERGFVKPERVVAIPEATGASVGAGFKTARGLAERFAPEDVLLLVVALGEGSADALRLADGELPLTTVTTLANDIPATLHVVTTDVCDPAAQGVEVALGRPPGGPTWLRAHGPCAKPSLAADWLTGLDAAADADGDRRITLGESYAYVAGQAVERGGVRTTGPFVDPASAVILTHDAEPATEISLVRGRGTLYRFFVHGETTPFAEARSLDDRDVRVRVPPGPLVVHVFGGEGQAGAVELRLRTGELRPLGPGEARPASHEVLAREGGALSRPHHEVSVSYGTALGGYASLAHGGAVRYAAVFGRYAFGLVGTASLAGETTAANENLITVFGARARVERRFFEETPQLALGVGLVGELTAQTLRRRDAGQVILSGYPTEERRRANGGGPEVYANVRTTIGGTSFFGLEVAGVLPIVRMGEQLRVFPRAEASVFAGLVY